MKLKLFSWLAVAIIGLWASPARSADDLEPVEFDVFRTNGSLAVWVDFASCLSSRRVEQLSEGIDVAFECRLELRRPRKIWGAVTIFEKDRLLKVGYRWITEDYQLTDYSLEGESERTFPSLAKLHQFLTDSVIVALGELDGLEEQHRYYINLKVTCITLTSFNLASDDERDIDEESPVRYLFRQFLEVTNFGREDFETRTRPFSLGELESLD